MEKVRYEIDPFNRLVFPKFRKALDGRFRVGKSGDLFYQVRSPASRGEKIPHQVKFKGEWSLTGGHKLRFTLDKWGRQTFGDQLTLSGEIIGVSEDSLVFALTTASKGGETTYALELSGVWKCDASNRLSFHVRRERDRYDILTFSGAWELGKDKKLIYRYLSSDLKAGRRRVHSLEFNGHWDIRKKYRISYMLGADTESAFDFRTGAGVYGRDYIRYEVGIGLSGRARPVERTIEIFGRWFVREGVGVVFEVKYAGHRTRAIVFGADAKLTGKDTVRLRLKTAEGNKDIGATVELSHRMLRGDGEAFLRALASRRELALYAGAAWRW